MTKLQQKIINDLKGGAFIQSRGGMHPSQIVVMPNGMSYRISNWKTYMAVRKLGKFKQEKVGAFLNKFIFEGMR